MIDNAYIAVDLDGTLAHYSPDRPMEEIGPPVPLMLKRVKEWISLGVEVRIMTARACHPPYIPAIEKWLVDNGIPGLKVTNEKTFGMMQLWDDRAIQVIENTGMPVNRIGVHGEPKIDPLKPGKNQVDTSEEV
jgi:hypothetical protein